LNNLEYVVRNLFVIAFMAFLWILTPLFHVTGSYLTIFIPLFMIAELFIGETLWEQVVYKKLAPLRRSYVD
jgi:hypothetical protein